MGVFQISYEFSWRDGGTAVFDLEFDEKSLLLLNNPSSDLPDWTDLDYCKCMNCTLDSNKIERCPAATSFVTVIEQFFNVTEQLEVEVKTEISDRLIVQTAPARQAVGSIIGLLFASSGCPRTVYFRPMVRYHIPLSNENETMIRVASMYTLSQYFKFKGGKEPDLDLKKLKDIYEELQTVNRSMAERMQAADGSDASINAMILLDMYAHAMPYEIEDSLKDLKYLFKPFYDSEQ